MSLECATLHLPPQHSSTPLPQRAVRARVEAERKLCASARARASFKSTYSPTRRPASGFWRLCFLFVKLFKNKPYLRSVDPRSNLRSVDRRILNQPILRSVDPSASGALPSLRAEHWGEAGRSQFFNAPTGEWVLDAMLFICKIV